MIFGFYRALTRLHLAHSTIFPQELITYILAPKIAVTINLTPTDSIIRPKSVAGQWSACPARRAILLKECPSTKLRQCSSHSIISIDAKILAFLQSNRALLGLFWRLHFSGRNRLARFRTDTRPPVHQLRRSRICL